jgi:hypothetical protein
MARTGHAEHGGPRASTIRRIRSPIIGSRPGTVLEIDSEAGAEMKSPGRPNPAFDPFFTAMAKQIAAAIEIPLEVLMLSSPPAIRRAAARSRSSTSPCASAASGWRRIGARRSIAPGCTSRSRAAATRCRAS